MIKILIILNSVKKEISFCVHLRNLREIIPVFKLFGSPVIDLSCFFIADIGFFSFSDYCAKLG